MSKWPIAHYVRFASLFAALGAAALAVSVSTPPAEATHSWGNYHWARTGNPFTLKLGDNVSSTWDPYLAITSVDWSKSTVLETRIVSGGGNKSCNTGTSGRDEICSKAYGWNGWLGLAQIWVGSPHIVKGIVKVNDTYFNTSTYNKSEWRNLVMCQEVGHTLGLGHNDEDFNTTKDTCMDYSNDPVPNQHPNLHDYEQLETIYAHLDSTTTVASIINPALASVPFAELRVAAVAATGPDDEDLNSPRAWGRLVSLTNGGRTGLYERDLGAGQRLLTRVIWAEPRGR